jgi:hypothetical protein
VVADGTTRPDRRESSLVNRDGQPSTYITRIAHMKTA